MRLGLRRHAHISCKPRQLGLLDEAIVAVANAKPVQWALTLIVSNSYSGFRCLQFALSPWGLSQVKASLSWAEPWAHRPAPSRCIHFLPQPPPRRASTKTALALALRTLERLLYGNHLRSLSLERSTSNPLCP